MKQASSAGSPAAVLVEARRAGRALPCFPSPLPETLDEAYAVQQDMLRRLARPVAGWKVGRIPAPLIDTLGAERLAGPVLRSHVLEREASGEAPIFKGGAGAIETEIMMRLDHVPAAMPESDDAARALVGDIRAGFEIASSPAPDVHDHAPYGIIADIGINNGIILGPGLGADFSEIEVETEIDGEIVGKGRARDILDGPLGSLRFLLDLHRQGVIRLEQGQWISAGAITGVHPIAIGQRATARFGDAVTLRCIATADTGLGS